MYFDINEVLSYNKLFNYIIGNRGAGKTFGAKERVIRDFLKSKKQFVWIRRYETELKEIRLFFADIKFKFPDVEFEVKGKKAFINGELAGHFMALSKAQSQKSTAFPLVDKIVFDEFIIDKGGWRYLPDEVETYLSLYETIARDRDVIAIFIANAITVTNPYFMYFKIIPSKNARFTTNKKSDIIIDNYANVDFIEHKYKTRFGQIIKGTEFGNYSIENKFLLDNDDYIAATPERLYLYGQIKYLDIYYSLFWDRDNDRLYIKDSKKIESMKAWALTTDDLEPNTLLIKNHKKIDVVNFLKLAFMDSKIYYNSINTKNRIFDAMSLLAIK